MLNTAMELATCDKCKAHVFTCHVGGIRVIVDPIPLDGLEDVRRRLMMGRTCYRILQGRKLAVFAPLSTKGGGYLADHWCTPGTTGAQVVPRADVGPPQAPVTPSAGHDPRTAPGSGSQGRSGPWSPNTAYSGRPSRAATLAIHPRSEKVPYINRVCEICGVMIGRSTNIIGVEYDGRWMWVQHDECPSATKEET